MAKQRAPLEFKSLSGGIITEANALTFPDNASLDEINFELMPDGTRKRRLGFELEVGAAQFNTGSAYGIGEYSVVSSFLWKNVTGNALIELLVVQYNALIVFYSTTDSSVSANQVGSYQVEDEFSGNIFGFTNLDGTLVVVTGSADIITIVADFTNQEVPTFSPSTDRLTIRDLFGVQVMYDRSVEVVGSTEIDLIDITDPIYITKRPLLDGLPVETSGALIDYTTDVALSQPVIVNVQDGPPVLLYDFLFSGNNRDLQTFSPSKYEGYTLLWYRATSYPEDAVATIKIEFSTSTGVPPFEYIRVVDNIMLVEMLMYKSGSNPYAYVATVTKAQFELLRSAVPDGFDFSIDGTVVGSPYHYNLRNQTFGPKRLPKTGDVSKDPVSEFLILSGKMPSMADSVISALYPNTEETNKTVDRFHAEDLLENPLGSSPSPKGYFIIDALNRSESRKVRWRELIEDQDLDEVEYSEIPADITPGGPRAVVEYGGRLWYGGFSEEGTISAAGATRLESYLLYSQLANSKSVLTRCYQSGDPTSIEAPEILDTDGGFLSLDGAYGVDRLIVLGNSLIAFGKNGVWAVTGSDGNYFTPTSPRVQKITSKGSVSIGAIVVVDNSVVYWAEDGIYLVSPEQLGGYNISSLTDKTIRTWYGEISFQDKQSVQGIYDAYAGTITWVYYNTLNRTQESEVMTLRVGTGAFTKYRIGDGVVDRTLVGYVPLPPYTLQYVEDIVTVGPEIVTAEAVNVTILNKTSLSRTFVTKGVVVSNIDGYSNISFGSETNEDFKDWGEVDAAAYMVTGYVSGGDFQRGKQVPYITFHFERTEDGFYEDVNGDIFPLHESSCKVQAQWDWANSVNSGRWSREFQAYRYRKLYSPTGATDPYDSGFATIVTKNKIRGGGRVLSLKVSTDESKDCRLLGWSAIMEVDNYV